MPRLAPISDPEKKPDACPTCGAEVQRVAGGLLVEKCKSGSGNVALVPDLFGGPLQATVVRGLKTTFRLHRCPPSLPQSFTAAGMQRKQRPPEPTAGRARGERKGRS